MHHPCLPLYSPQFNAQSHRLSNIEQRPPPRIISPSHNSSTAYLQHLIPNSQQQFSYDSNIPKNIQTVRFVSPSSLIQTGTFKSNQSQIPNITFQQSQPQQISSGHVNEILPINSNQVSYCLSNGNKISRSSSHHNIKITINSDIGQSTPTITISPNNQQMQSRLHKVNSAIITGQQIYNTRPFPIAAQARPSNISQTIINKQYSQPHQPLIVSQPPAIITHHHPILVQERTTKSGIAQNTQISYSNNSQLPYPFVPNNNQAHEAKRDKIFSLSSLNQNSKVNKKVENARHEYYNELYNDSLEKGEESTLNGGRRGGLSAYLLQQKWAINSRRLVDEIFENETHKALLQMSELEGRSREKRVRKSQSRKMMRRRC